jgi:hypothetical protein
MVSAAEESLLGTHPSNLTLADVVPATFLSSEEKSVMRITVPRSNRVEAGTHESCTGRRFDHRLRDGGVR